MPDIDGVAIATEHLSAVQQAAEREITDRFALATLDLAIKGVLKRLRINRHEQALVRRYAEEGMNPASAVRGEIPKLIKVDQSTELTNAQRIQSINKLEAFGWISGVPTGKGKTQYKFSFGQGFA